MKYVNGWHPAECLSSVTKWMRVYIKALTETSVTSPYSPPATPELSHCSSTAPYLAHAHKGIYDFERVTSSGQVHRVESFFFSSSNRLQCRSNEYWFIPVLSSIDPYVPFHSVIHACYPVPWNNKYFVVLKRSKCCLTLILLMLTITSSVGLRIYWWWSCGSWVGLMTVQLRSQMASHYSILNETLQAGFDLAVFFFSRLLLQPEVGQSE